MEDYMKKYSVVKRGIEQNDVQLLRVALGNVCFVDRDFSKGEFDNLVSFIVEKGIKLKDNDLVGELVSKGKVEYTDEDFASAVFELKENFCDERISEVKKIGKILYEKNKQVVPEKQADRSLLKIGEQEEILPKKSLSHQKEQKMMPIGQKNLMAVPWWGWVILLIILALLLIHI